MSLREIKMGVTQITDKNYAELINKEIPLIIDHFADWCGPCKLLSPIFEKVSNSYNGRLEFGKLDTEAYPDIAAQNSVLSIPCLIIFHKGKEVNRIIGYMNEDKLSSTIDNILKGIK